MTSNANRGLSLIECPGYEPDIVAMGDCKNCGWIQQRHPKNLRERIELILSPAINTKAPYAIQMVDTIMRAISRETTA